MSTLNFFRIKSALILAAASFLTVLGFINSLYGQGFDQASAHLKSDACAIVRIDSTVFDALLGTEELDPQQQTVLNDRLKKTRTILDGDAVWLTVGFPKMPLSVQIVVRDPNKDRIEKLKNLWDFPKSYPFSKESSVVFRRLSEPGAQKPADANRLAKWKQLMVSAKNFSSGQGAIEFACLPPAHLYETYQELLPRLPGSLGGGPITLLTDGALSLSGTFDLTTGALKSEIESASPEAATALSEHATTVANWGSGSQMMERFFKGEQEAKKMKRMQPLIQHMASSLFQSDQKQVTWEIQPSETWRVENSIELALGSFSNRSSMKKLRDLAWGILNFESAHQHFPPLTKTHVAQPSKGLSWRVHLLPFLGELELYKQFSLDEPWDSPTNIRLLPQMPSAYSKYSLNLFAPVDAQGYTTFVAPSSEDTVLCAPRKVTFGSINDGSSNTILLVAIKDSLAVPWTAPRDYVFENDKPADGLKFTDGKAPVAMCDGSALLLSENNQWKDLFEMNDGKIVQFQH